MEEDSEILRYAQELSRQISPGRPEPDTLSWDEKVPVDSVVVRYGEVKLPRGMRGRLTAEDWRPLLAASIIYSKDLRKEQTQGALVRLVLPAGLAEIPLVYAFLQVFKMSNGQSDIDLLLVVVAWVVFSISLIWSFTYRLYRSLFYSADKRAAEMLGTDELLQSLLKYRDIASVSNVPRPFSLLPSINQRIQKLERFQRSS